MKLPHIPAALLAGLLSVAGLSAVSFHAAPSFAAERAVRVPPPAFDPPQPGKRAVAVFAGGCFWGVQGVYQHVRGVHSAVSGYTGGTALAANYDEVSNGGTGHAEAVRIVYDPAQVSYGKLLQIYFSVVADPTQLNRQGPDVGTQYRSAIYPLNEAQRRVAAGYIAQLGKAKLWSRPIVTRLERAQAFHPAEGYHQDFLSRNPRHPYIVMHDLPKVAALKSFFPNHYRANPALVRQS